MDQFLRVVAVFLEVSVLAGMMGSIFWGVRLLTVDLGVGSKYSKAIIIALSVFFVLFVFFFIMHLTSFYPVYHGA
jgi:hypothetical protein